MVAAARPTHLLARCCAALALGVLVGPYSTGQRQTLLIAFAVAAVVALPLLLAILADRAITHKVTGMALAVGAVGLAGLALRLLVAWLFGWTRGAPDFILLAAILLAPLVAGFAFGCTALRMGEMFRPATLTGLFAWLGVGLHFFAVSLAAAARKTPSGMDTAIRSQSLDLIGVIFTLVLLAFAMGCVYAAGAGLLGVAGRRALARLTGER